MRLPVSFGPDEVFLEQVNSSNCPFSDSGMVLRDRTARSFLLSRSPDRYRRAAFTLLLLPEMGFFWVLFIFFNASFVGL
jgi:hypothetical protein